jgi:GC-rich sequence DNA-binding factor
MRFSQTMTSMVSSHAQNTTSVSALSAEQVQLDERETELRDIVTRAEGKRSWFADFRDWLESVATFFDEKVRSWWCPNLPRYLIPRP